MKNMPGILFLDLANKIKPNYMRQRQMETDRETERDPPLSTGLH